MPTQDSRANLRVTTLARHFARNNTGRPLRAPTWRATARATSQKKMTQHSPTCASGCAPHPGALTRAQQHRRITRTNIAPARHLARPNLARYITRDLTEDLTITAQHLRAGLRVSSRRATARATPLPSNTNAHNTATHTHGHATQHQVPGHTIWHTKHDSHTAHEPKARCLGHGTTHNNNLTTTKTSLTSLDMTNNKDQQHSPILKCHSHRQHIKHHQGNIIA